MTTLDEVDYAVLKCLDQCNGSWKKQVHQWVHQHIDEIPRLEEKSVQTIGRRIDDLQDDKLVESCIVSPDSVNRDMIIGYKITEHGRNSLKQKRGQMLKDMVSRSTEHLISGNDELSIDRNGLIALMCNEFGIDDEPRKTLIDPLSTRELISVLTCHYMKRNADNNIQKQNEPLVAELIQRTQLNEPFLADNASTRIQETVQLNAENIEKTASQELDPEAEQETELQ